MGHRPSGEPGKVLQKLIYAPTSGGYTIFIGGFSMKSFSDEEFRFKLPVEIMINKIKTVTIRTSTLRPTSLPSNAIGTGLEYQDHIKTSWTARLKP